MKKHAAMKEKQLVDKESEEMETIKEESLDLKIMGNPNNKNPFVHSDEEIFHEDGLTHVEQGAKGRWFANVITGYQFPNGSPVTGWKREGRTESKVVEGVIN